VDVYSLSDRECYHGENDVMTKPTKKLGLIVVNFALLVWLAGLTVVTMEAQGPSTNYAGYSAVWSSQNPGPCASNGSFYICPSGEFIDATQVGGTDLCAMINTALKNAISNALKSVVVDARGVTTLGCTSNPFGSLNGTIGSTVLLPPGIITLSASTWMLPANTRIVGEGTDVTVLSASSGTALQMGLSSGSATGVGIEDLTINLGSGGGTAIENLSAADLSYVRRVNIIASSINTTGLQIDSNAKNSGPYTEISFSGPNSGSPTGNYFCVYIAASGVTVKGITCGGSGTNNFNSAITINSYNDVVEDVTITPEYETGVVMLSNSDVGNNAVVNVTGASAGTVVICPTGLVGAAAACALSSGDSSPMDISLLGISTGTTGTFSILDGVPGVYLSDSYVAMYILGEAVTVNSTTGVQGYARFTTSPNTITWGAGSGVPTTNCSSTTNTKGSLFSNTSTSGSALYVCTGTGTDGWYAIPTIP